MHIMEGSRNRWLANSEVRYQIQKVDGQWKVSLIFTDTVNPVRFLIRDIGSYRTEKLAHSSGSIMKTLASRDSRGTQKADEDAYDIDYN